MNNKSYKVSRWIHKYLGLVLLVFLLWMSLSGVLLNHPVAMRSSSVPSFIVPKSYHPNNWNRSTMKSLLYIDEKKDSALVYGNQGVFLSIGDVQGYKSFMDGEYPKAAWKKRTNNVVVDTFNNRLLAGTNGGLYECNIGTCLWKRIDLFGEKDPIRKILQLPDRIVLVTKSCLYVADNNDVNSFKKVIPKKDKETTTISLVRVFFQLHDGSLWGLPGKILWDIAGLVLFFLCVSAFYIWYYPKKWKYRRKVLKSKNFKDVASQDASSLTEGSKGAGSLSTASRSAIYQGVGPKGVDSEKKKRSFFLMYHKKLGWYFSFLLLVIFFTGMFMRPPLIIALTRGNIDKKWYPAVSNENSWHNKIRNALYDTEKDEIVLDCKDGIWAGSLKGDKVFKRLDIPVKIFAMGATVFEEKQKGTWLIGSFGGLQEYNTQLKETKVLVGSKKNNSAGRPAKTMVTGYFQLSDGTECVLGHRKGLCNMNGVRENNVLVMPEAIKENYRMPLWNFLFELHNARIFRSFLGGIYILIIPLFGLLSLLILFSGVFDYWFVKVKAKKNKGR